MTERRKIIFESRDKEKDLLQMIKSELEKVLEKPKKIILDKNAYSIMLRYFEFTIADIENEIYGIPVIVSDDKTIDYFKFEF